MLLRFRCSLVFLGTLSVAPIVSANIRISSYHDTKVVSMLVLMDFTVSMTVLTLLKALYTSWSRYCSFAERDFASSNTFLVMTKTAIFWNDDRAAFNPCAFTRVSVSQFQLPSSHSNWGYSWGDKMASKKMTSGSYSSRKTSKHVCLSTHRVLHRPGSLLCEEAGKNSLTVSSNILCRLGLFDRKKCASFIVETRFLTSCTWQEAAMDRLRQCE